MVSLEYHMLYDLLIADDVNQQCQDQLLEASSRLEKILKISPHFVIYPTFSSV